jgi:RNA polymerase sigma factor (sigma-70 family)
MSAVTVAPAPAPAPAVRPEDHLGLVYDLAYRFWRPGQLDFDSLVSEGMLGLLKAIRSYDASRGAFAPHLAVVVRQTIAKGVRRCRMLNQLPKAKDGGEDPLAQVPAPEPKEDRGEEVALLLRLLPERERQVVELCYGINGEPERTYEEVGRVLGISRARVGQLLERILSRLREAASQRPLV